MDQTYFKKRKNTFYLFNKLSFSTILLKISLLLYFSCLEASNCGSQFFKTFPFCLQILLSSYLVLSKVVACIQLRAYKQNSVLYTRVADAKAKSQKSGKIIKIQDLIHIVNRKKWYTLSATQLGLA